MSLRGLSSRILLIVGLVVAGAATPANAAPEDFVKSDNITLQAHLDLPAGARINSDIAFQGDYAYVGNFTGFAIYDIKHPQRPRLVSSVSCPGGQMDVTILGNLLVTSVDDSLSNDSCQAVPQSARIKESWEGLRIFDVSDKANPRYIKSVETNCGSHTHTMVPDKTGEAFYVYVSSYFPSVNFPDCQPPHDKISVVKVPIADPGAAAVVSTPAIFPDGTGYPGAASTSGCHDITVYAALDLAAGACMGDGVLLDISNREQPRVIEQVTDANFAFWHSATFNNDGTKVIFTDELGGGTSPRCTATEGPTRGADAIFDIESNQLVFKSYFKISRLQTLTENCVAHNGSLIPVKNRDVMVQAWYQGGLSVFDFTDSANPVEIAYFDRAPFNDSQLTLAGYWSTYYYNGYIFGSEIARGFDVFKVNDPRVNQAGSVKTDLLNAQTQERYRERGNGRPGGGH
ncbi:LVIVD repeat-containing protein [Nonomuraea sp. NPDC050663]|uniref:LVIVD repeat-containing protein n=1 Tax=Nonomuraea sp. NPDC050663 TaxID=3364370 RepID=UPI00378A0F32